MNGAQKTSRRRWLEGAIVGARVAILSMVAVWLSTRLHLEPTRWVDGLMVAIGTILTPGFGFAHPVGIVLVGILHVAEIAGACGVFVAVVAMNALTYGAAWAAWAEHGAASASRESWRPCSGGQAQGSRSWCLRARTCEES